jgi:hypothetical protein
VLNPATRNIIIGGVRRNMLKIMFPGIAALLIFFGAVGIVIGMLPFILAGVAGVVLALYGLSYALLRTRRAAYLRHNGVLAEARLDRIKRDTSGWNTKPYRTIDIICTCVSPARFSGQVVHSGMFIDYDNLAESPPAKFIVKIDPNHTKRYYLDLTAYGIPPSRIQLFRMTRFSFVFVAVGIVALGITICSSLQVGMGSAAFRADQASGTVVASGGILHDWSMKPNACTSGAVDGFHGVYLFSTQNPNQQISLIGDRVAGDELDADIPEQDKHFRFFQADCKVFSLNLVPMSSMVNNVTNLQGHLDAECAATGANISVHVTFRTCH